jgi:SNF2 family DNA or RNA helicase
VRRFILGDDMGLGKSMQSIIAALESGAKKKY